MADFTGGRCVGETPIKRNANDVFKVEINGVGCHRIGKSIEGLLQRGLEFSDDRYNFVNRRLVDQAMGSINEQPNVFVKLNIRGKLHRSFGFSLCPRQFYPNKEQNDGADDGHNETGRMKR
jgi:hypothetical protein